MGPMRRFPHEWKPGRSRNRANQCRFHGAGEYKVRWHRDQKIALITRAFVCVVRAVFVLQQLQNRTGRQLFLFFETVCQINFRGDEMDETRTKKPDDVPFKGGEGAFHGYSGKPPTGNSWGGGWTPPRQRDKAQESNPPSDVTCDGCGGPAKLVDCGQAGRRLDCPTCGFRGFRR